MNRSNEGCVVFEPHEGPNWNRDSRRELVDLYLRQMGLPFLAQHFEVSQRDLVRELSKLLLDVTEPYENRFVKNYGAKWNMVDDEKLQVCFRRGYSIAEISRLLGRDALGICFRILSNFDVVVPKETYSNLGLEEYWATETNPDGYKWMALV